MLQTSHPILPVTFPVKCQLSTVFLKVILLLTLPPWYPHLCEIGIHKGIEDAEGADLFRSPHASSLIHYHDMDFQTG